MSHDDDHLPFWKWITRPNAIIAFSALVLSLCGIFIALYEASILRRMERASVWPHVAVGVRFHYNHGGGPADVSLRATNYGVGPALIRTAAITYEDEVVPSWPDLLLRIEPESETTSYDFLALNGRVLPATAEPAVVFELTADEDEEEKRALILTVFSKILDEDGPVNLAVCYCSIHDECWTTSLLDAGWRSPGAAPAAGPQKVDDCEGQPRSAI